MYKKKKVIINLLYVEHDRHINTVNKLIADVLFRIIKK